MAATLTKERAMLELTNGDWSLGGRPSMRGMAGMVAAAHPLAANAGAEMLRRGGNAFDAVAATAAALNVVEPFMSGLAGAGAATFLRAETGEVSCIDFIPPAPSELRPAEMDGAIAMTGPLAPCTPGNLAGWHGLQSRYGKLNFADVLQPAIRLATDGFPISPFFIVETRTSINRIKDPDWRRIFRPEHDWKPGEVLKLPDLAATLEAIAKNGIEHLYGGELGQKLADHLDREGGVITLKDLEAVSPTIETPIKAAYRDRVIHVPPPPAESFQMLLALRILESFDIATLGFLSAGHLDLVFRVIRIAAGLRIKHNRCSPKDAAALLANVEEFITRAGDGNPVNGPTEKWSGDADFSNDAPKENTTSMSVADAEGNMVCLTQSLGSAYGSGVMIPGTGVLLNNFLNWTDLNPASPNALQPGQRMAMCLAPSISTRDGKGVLALGTPGSYGILQTQVQAMVGHVDFGLDLQAAIDMPRARLWDGTQIYLERRVPHTVCRELSARGHDVTLLPDFSWRAGGMQAVSRDPDSGALTGAADSRRDGAAIPA
jgi:gamma-glutamyltranspeptidase/glutathione hydrolase